MREVETLIVGGGITGLSVAALLGRDADYLVLERERELGGYCRTVKRDGFTWDHSGHFFHFREPRVERWLRARMRGQEVRTVAKRSYVHWGDRLVDFPFQKNIHQLPQGEFVEVLHDLYFAQRHPPATPPRDLEEMLLGRYGRAMSEKFLVPYNEKLYATRLSALDPEAMGRFFPHVALDEVIRNMRAPDHGGYNATFTYPAGGAAAYVQALASEVRPDAVRLDEALLRLVPAAREAETTRGHYRYRRLVSSLPFPRLLALAGETAGPEFAWNQVLVLNLGFDRKGPREVHWIYYPQRDLPFYRVGFYDNIFESPRMSLYVELGFDRAARPDPERSLPAVLGGLRRAGVVTDQALVAWDAVLMNPAYVHVTAAGTREHARRSAALAAQEVHAMGRYGRWTYCSIEDNMLEAEAWVRARGGGRFEG